MPIRGKYQARVTDHADDPAKALTAIAHLCHEEAFDPVPASELGIAGTRYEARWSESCEICGTIWIGTKAGEVLCLDLGHATPRVLSLTLDRGVRTLLHLHGPNAFGPGHSLLVGTDDGFLRLLREVRGKLAEAEPSWHVESWWAAAGADGAPGQVAPGSSARVIRATESIARTDDDRYTVGITAMARLREDASGTSPILITTRRGAIFLLEAEPALESEPARLRLRWLHTMTGWVQWILTIPGSDRVACISRGGELIRISITDPALAIKTERLPLPPTAAAPLLEGFMLGTSEGLMYWWEQDQERSPHGDHRQRVVSLPLTRSPVLCLDRMTIRGEDRHGATHEREYVILGLATGRLRVWRSDLVRDLAERRPPAPGARSRALDLGSSILAVEVLRPRGDDLSRCYVLVALQDHSLRLFHIDSIETTEALIETHWSALGVKIGEDDDRRIAEELLSSATTPADRDAVRYFLVQALHRPIAAQDASYRQWLLAQIPTFLRQTSPALLRLVALELGKLARDDADALLDISLALLQALPERHADWRRVAEQHLKVLNDKASTLTREEGARLIAWTRFARKYVILGDGFSEKKLALRSLVRMNYRTHKYLDALICQALLFQRRHDLEWQAELDGEVHSLHTTESLVIAATRAGVLWFFSTSGRRLDVVSKGVESPSVSVGIDCGHLHRARLLHRDDHGRDVCRIDPRGGRRGRAGLARDPRQLGRRGPPLAHSSLRRPRRHTADPGHGDRKRAGVLSRNPEGRERRPGDLRAQQLLFSRTAPRPGLAGEPVDREPRPLHRLFSGLDPGDRLVLPVGDRANLRALPGEPAATLRLHHPRRGASRRARGPRLEAPGQGRRAGPGPDRQGLCGAVPPGERGAKEVPQRLQEEHSRAMVQGGDRQLPRPGRGAVGP